jgi:hypothetical protein
MDLQISRRGANPRRPRRFISNDKREKFAGFPAQPPSPRLRRPDGVRGGRRNIFINHPGGVEYTWPGATQVNSIYAPGECGVNQTGWHVFLRWTEQCQADKNVNNQWICKAVRENPERVFVKTRDDLGPLRTVMHLDVTSAIKTGTHAASDATSRIQT